MRRAFDGEGLGLILYPSLIRRAERLLADYLFHLRGFQPVQALRGEDLWGVVNAGLAGHRRPGESWDDYHQALTADANFDDWLLTRIARRPLLDAVGVTMPEMPPTQWVTIDRERFQDLLTTLLEHLVGIGIREILVGSESQGPSPRVSIQARYDPRGAAIRTRHPPLISNGWRP